MSEDSLMLMITMEKNKQNDDPKISIDVVCF